MGTQLVATSKGTGDRLLSVRLSTALYSRLDIACAAAGITVSEGIRQLICTLSIVEIQVPTADPNVSPDPAE